MTMSNEEIIRDYNQASNKSKQIKILADLNCCSPGEIKKVLAEAGVAGVKMPERIVQRKPEAQEPEQQCSGLSGPSIYDRIETILAALPEDASDYIRNTAVTMVVALFREHLERRLGKVMQNETDEHN